MRIPGKHATANTVRIWGGGGVDLPHIIAGRSYDTYSIFAYTLVVLGRGGTGGGLEARDEVRANALNGETNLVNG